MLENVYEGLNAGPKVYLSKEYVCKIYPTCVSSKLCEFISGSYLFAVMNRISAPNFDFVATLISF